MQKRKTPLGIFEGNTKFSSRGGHLTTKEYKIEERSSITLTVRQMTQTSQLLLRATFFQKFELLNFQNFFLSL